MTDLDRLGYFFDDENVLRTKSDNEKFKFTTQEAYEDLGEAVEEEVYRLLEKRCNLNRIPLKPENSDVSDEDVSFVFLSKNYKNAKKMLVLMHGSGVVRAGQWARRLIINENLECGTQIPFIERAQANGWAVLVLNTNLNETQEEDLKFSGTPAQHANLAFKLFVDGSNLKEVFVVAHSRGGYDLSCVLKTRGSDDRIKKVCLTDSPYFQFPSLSTERTTPLYAINFLARGNYSSKDYDIKPYQTGRVANLYAGTQIHEWSSHCAIDAIFKFFEEEFDEKTYEKVLATVKSLVLKEEKEEKEAKDEVDEEGEEGVDDEEDEDEPTPKKSRQ